MGESKMDWNECLKKSIAKEVSTDHYLIKSLINTSDKKHKSQEQLTLSETTAGSKVTLEYDALREVLEALAIKNGFKIYNHECYTHFLKEILKESEKGDEFDDLRKIRNSINYYAKEITTKDASNVIERIKKLRKEALKLLNQQDNKQQSL